MRKRACGRGSARWFESSRAITSRAGLSPEKLRAILEDLGPTYVKLGQIVSTRGDLMPEAYCAELFETAHGSRAHAHPDRSRGYRGRIRKTGGRGVSKP